MIPDQEIEQQIQAKGLTAPRIHPEHIDNLVDSLEVHTHHFPGTTATVAIATLPGGYVAGRGFSACVSAENFDADIGRDVAAEDALSNARKHLWEMEGYALYKAIQGAK